jgi:hypothetical protein
LHRCHEADKLRLERDDFVLRELVVALHIGPVAAYEVLEGESAGEPYWGRIRVGGNDVQEGEREIGLLLGVTQRGFGCTRRKALALEVGTGGQDGCPWDI